MYKSLQKVQSQALRVITGAYRTTPIATLHYEAFVTPIKHYLTKTTLRHTIRSQGSKAQQAIQTRCKEVAESIQKMQGKKKGRRKGKRGTSLMNRTGAQGQAQPLPPRATALLEATQSPEKWAGSFAAEGRWIDNKWKQEWEELRTQKLLQRGRGQEIQPTWAQPWMMMMMMMMIHLHPISVKDYVGWLLHQEQFHYTCDCIFNSPYVVLSHAPACPVYLYSLPACPPSPSSPALSPSPSPSIIHSLVEIPVSLRNWTASPIPSFVPRTVPRLRGPFRPLLISFLCVV